MRVLVLGAGVYQVPLIRRAKAEGFFVAVASYNANDPGMELADEAWIVDTTDQETLLKRSRQSGIELVVTAGTDVAIPSIGFINDALSLPGINYNAAMACTDKAIMQNRFKQHGVPAAKSFVVQSFEEAEVVAEKIGFPVVVKAPDSSGSRGVTVVKSPELLRDAFNAAQAVSRQTHILVEELLKGVEFGAQAVVRDHCLLDVICHYDLVTPPPVSVPIGHSMPVTFDLADLNRIKTVVRQGVEALGISCAVCNCDLMMTDEGPKVLEIGARLGATGIPDIVLASTGIDLWEAVLRLTDREYTYTPLSMATTLRGAGVCLIRAPKTGKLACVENLGNYIDHAEVVSIELDCQPGNWVREFRVGPDRVGMVVVSGNTAQSADRFAQEIADAITLRIE